MIQRFVLYGSLCVLLSITAAFAQNFDLKPRQTWDGPYDIKMIAAPNLEAVYVNAALAPSGVLKADSVIPYRTMVMSDGKLSTNNRYKESLSPFFSSIDEIAVPSVRCPDINSACMIGIPTQAPNSSCPIRYNNPSVVPDFFASMNYADYDNDMSTFSSSMSELSISKCSEIESAYLYWAGFFTGSNKAITLAPNQSYNGTPDVFSVSTTSGYDKIKFKKPGGTYQEVTADTTYLETRSYVAMANVTDIVKGTGAGQFWAANIQSYPNDNNGGSSSGWVLVVIFRSPLSPPRLISLWDGYKAITKNNSQDFVLSNLQTPATNDFKSYVGFAVLDGENIASELNNDTPEGLGFQTSSATTSGASFNINPFDTDQPHYKLWTSKGLPAKTRDGDANVDNCKKPLFDANWVSGFDGISSSHITSYDERNGKNGNEIVRLPSNKNTLGLDAHHILLPTGAVIPEANSATLTVKAGPQGGTSPFLAYIAIERLQPKIVLTKKANKVFTGLDSVITYTLRVNNEGNDTSLVGDMVFDTLDVGTNFVPGSLTTIPASAATLVSSADNKLQIRLDNRILGGDSVDLVFQVKVKDYDNNKDLWNTQCKRSIVNVAYVEYSTKTTGKIKVRSNSIDCGPSSVTTVLLRDERFKAIPDSLGPFNATFYRHESVELHVRDELVKSTKVPSGDETNYVVYDAKSIPLTSGQTFPDTGSVVIYYAIKNNNTAGDCQKIFKLKFILGIPPLESIRIDNSCAGYTTSGRVITPADQTAFGGNLVITPEDRDTTIITAANQKLVVSKQTNFYDYVSAPSFTGKDSASIKLIFRTTKDDFVYKKFYITVNPVNHAPIVKNEHFTTYRNQAITGFSVLSNDKDPNGDVIAAIPSSDDAFYHDKTFKLYKDGLDSINTNNVKLYNKIIDSVHVKPKHGTLTFNSKGEFTYTPNLDEGKDAPVRDTAVFWVCDYSQKTYCNPFFCKLDLVVFEIKPYTIFIPEGFSPNNDGINDFFFIDAEVPVKTHIMVYNRWGSLVYENKEYKNDWDGKANKGVVMGDGVPDGTYYVYVNVNDKEVEQFRYITINR